MDNLPLQLRIETQQNPVADEFSAVIAVLRPILEGVLFAINSEVVAQMGGHKSIPLFMLPRLYRPGDGDCGICFEYAVHDAIRRGEHSVMERVVDSLGKRHCRVPGKETTSILFGAEKNGAIKLIETAHDLLTDDSRLLTGAQAQPIKLRRYINIMAAAFRRRSTRPSLPTSISGLWKADLFIGNRDSDRWVGTTVKINPNHLEPASGLRIGIVPAQQGASDKVRFNEAKNIVVCPLPYDAAFMQLFYSAWVIIQAFIAADAHLPGPAALPRPVDRQVARMLVERREFPILDVIAALRPIAQPELLLPQKQTSDPIVEKAGKTLVETIITPISRTMA